MSNGILKQHNLLTQKDEEKYSNKDPNSEQKLQQTPENSAGRRSVVFNQSDFLQ